MFIALVVLVVLLSLALLGSAAGKFTRQPKIVESLTGLGVPVERLPLLAALEIAGVAGLIIGLWVPALGIAAGVGVVLYFLGAVVAHLRAHDHEIVPPLVLCVLAIATVVLRVATI